MPLVGKMTKKKKRGKKKSRTGAEFPSGSVMWVCTDLMGQSGWGNCSQSFRR